MATAKMKIIIPLVVWITWLHTTTGQSFGGIGFGIRREVFFLNLEDGYFGCQVNESTDVLQLFELSKLCDGTPNCFLGSDELTKELKCTGECLTFVVAFYFGHDFKVVVFSVTVTEGWTLITTYEKNSRQEK
uniref:Uncharacterized protein LOC114327498 n=1 Tax=Diabrotica virgifera virgifera TaxID=50390 RepID=A0A6P7FF96_DIAVI